MPADLVGMPADLVTRDVILRLFLGTPRRRCPRSKAEFRRRSRHPRSTRYQRADVRARVPGYDRDRAIMSRHRCPRPHKEKAPR
jgi:hypothetical protein